MLGLPLRVIAVSTSGKIIKRLRVGRAIRSDRLGETLLPKRIALPVFASTALSLTVTEKPFEGAGAGFVGREQ